MNQLTTFEGLEEFGRVRLSANFFMRDFLYSEIASWHRIPNIPDNPDLAIRVGRQLCTQLLEPLQATFGRLEIRSAYRSPQVNQFGNQNKLNCATNESNFAGHIWDHADASGGHGATACIVIPWLIDHIANGGRWTDMAWWIHDHLPYNTLRFFSKLAAFNINWHERPQRRIDSYADPKGCLTRHGMTNHSGSHADQYPSFPSLSVLAASPEPLSVIASTAGMVDAAIRSENVARVVAPSFASTTVPHRGSNKKSTAAGRIVYRAVHTKTLWRKVSSHQSLDTAINGKDGAAGLFSRKARIDYQLHGDPLYVLVWEAESAQEGYVVKQDPEASNAIKVTSIPIRLLAQFENRSEACADELEMWF